MARASLVQHVGADEARDAAEVATRALEYLKRHHCVSIATDGAEERVAAAIGDDAEIFLDHASRDARVQIAATHLRGTTAP